MPPLTTLFLEVVCMCQSQDYGFSLQHLFGDILNAETKLGWHPLTLLIFLIS